MSFFVRPSSHVRPVPAEIVYHIARGEMCNWFNEHDGAIGWMKPTHRGIQRLDRIVIPKKQRRYIEDPSFEIRYNTAFEQVLAHCADLRRQGKTWITPELAAGLRELNRQGYCYSCETWQGGQLVGGLFGMHVGSFVSADSMFHTVDNASKAAYVRNLIHLRERGFTFVDVNYASETVLRYGGEWVAQWEFERMARPLLGTPLTIVDGEPPAALGGGLAARLRLEQLAAGALRKLRRSRARTDVAAPQAVPQPDPTPTPTPTPTPANRPQPARHAA